MVKDELLLYNHYCYYSDYKKADRCHTVTQIQFKDTTANVIGSEGVLFIYITLYHSVYTTFYMLEIVAGRISMLTCDANVVGYKDENK